MHYSTALLFSGISGLTAASSLARRAATFPAGTVFDIALDGSKISLSQWQKAKGTVVDLDLEDNWDNGQSTLIADLAKTKTVICYFSAGTSENWRSDYDEFDPKDIGKSMPEWDGENWLNVKSDGVRAIMKTRIETAKKAGCHAVDPDNVDGFQDNQDGWNLDKSAYVDYIKYMAQIASDNGLAIGLKNALDIIPDVLSVVQFAVNEQCHAEKECDGYKSFTTANKAVFNIEYGLNDCSDPTGVNLSTVVKGTDPEDQELDTLGGQC